MSNISSKKIQAKLHKTNSRKSQDYLGNLINNKILPLPWFFWPKEGRLIMGLIAFWSISGIFILGSASWWVAIREMGDGAFYIKRQIIWLTASWSIFYVAININLKKYSEYEDARGRNFYEINIKKSKDNKNLKRCYFLNWSENDQYNLLLYNDYNWK